MVKEPKKFSDLGINVDHKKFVGNKVQLHKYINIEMVIHDYEIRPSKYPERGSNDCLWLQISMEDKMYVTFSVSKVLMKTLKLIPEEGFPFSTTIVNKNDCYELT